MKFSRLVIVTVLWVLMSTPCFAQKYTVQVVGKNSGDPEVKYSLMGINDSGKVIVGKYQRGSYSRPYIWDKEKGLQPLPVSLPNMVDNEIVVKSINKNGEIVGTFQQPTAWFTALWRPTKDGYTVSLVDDPEHTGTPLKGNVFRINDQGDILGKDAISNKPYVKTKAGQMIHFGNGSWELNKMNNRQQVAVHSKSGFGDLNGHAGLWDAQTGTLTDLGVLSSVKNFSIAYGINDLSEVVGSSKTDGTQSPSHAFYYKKAPMQDLGTLTGYDQSSARDVNNNGQAVGSLYAKNFTVEVGMVYHESGGMKKLNDLISTDTPGWNIQSAQAINNNGQIVAYGMLNNEQYIVRLDPIFIPGDCNSDGTLDISDGKKVLDYLYSGAAILSKKACDVNGNTEVEMADAIYIFNFLFFGGPAPVK